MNYVKARRWVDNHGKDEMKERARVPLRKQMAKLGIGKMNTRKEVTEALLMVWGEWDVSLGAAQLSRFKSIECIRIQKPANFNGSRNSSACV